MILPRALERIEYRLSQREFERDSTTSILVAPS